MLKGSLFTTYFLFFIGSLVTAIILVYFILWGGLGIIKTLTYYSARANAELISSLISASSSFYGDFDFTYEFEPMNCSLEIKENEVNVTIPSSTVFVERTQIVIKKTSEFILPITKPDYITINEFSTECDPEVKKSFNSAKHEDDIGFE